MKNIFMMRAQSRGHSGFAKVITMLALLMTAATGAWAETTIVTWTSSGSYENNSRGGVTLSGEVVEYIWDDLSGGEWRLAYDSEQGTFTTSLGNFTSIVISGGYIDGFFGTGWNGRTWTGNASSVPFTGYLTDDNGQEPWTITFTIASPEPVTGVTLNQYEAQMTVGGETLTLTATVAPDGATDKSVTWSTSDGNVATVDNGVVTAVAAGNATITVTTTDGEFTATCAVTVAAPIPPTYTVKMKAGTEDAANWTIASGENSVTGDAADGLTGLNEGDAVTLTYSGRLKVKGVKATSDAAPAEGHPLSASEVGEIVCSDGLAYAAADKDNLPTGVTAVAIVAYVGDAGSVDASSSTYKGLAIAMSDANDGSSCGWGDYFTSYNCVSKSNDIATAIGYKDGISSTNTLTSDGHYHEAATAAASNNGTAAPTGTSGWFLPSMGQWNLIVQGLASKKAGSAVTTDISTSGNDTYTASNLNSVITDAGGTGFDGGYQSSTQYDSDDCWHMEISSGRASNYVFYAGDYVRSVLAF